MIKEHQQLCNQYEYLQTELDKFKSEMNNINYHSWLEKELGYSVDLNTVHDYIDFMETNISEVNNNINYAGDLSCFVILIILFIGLVLTVMCSPTVVFMLITVLIWIFLCVLSLEINMNFIDRKRQRTREAWKLKYTKYKEESALPQDLQEIIDLSPVYYCNDDNELCETLYYTALNRTTNKGSVK